MSYDEVQPPEAISLASPRRGEKRRDEKNSCLESTAHVLSRRKKSRREKKRTEKRRAEYCAVRGLFWPKGLMDANLKWMLKHLFSPELLNRRSLSTILHDLVLHEAALSLIRHYSDWYWTTESILSPGRIPPVRYPADKYRAGWECLYSEQSLSFSIHFKSTGGDKQIKGNVREGRPMCKDREREKYRKTDHHIDCCVPHFSFC